VRRTSGVQSLMRAVMRHETRMLCLIFDLDGTLVDSEPLCSQAFLDILPHLDDTVPGLMRRYRGMQLARVFSDLARRMGRALPEDFETTYRARVSQLYDESLEPMPGAVEMLSALPHAKCVASNGPMAKTLHGLRVSGMAHFFGDNVFSSYQVGHWKPEPHLFLHAARTMKYSPEQCLVVEDSEAGLQAAESAGMRAICFSPHDVRPSGGAYAYVNNLIELPDVIQSAAHAA
jgi:HAD superfamily hydrolase (TIGR01509 family)